MNAEQMFKIKKGYQDIMGDSLLEMYSFIELLKRGGYEDMPQKIWEYFLPYLQETKVGDKVGAEIIVDYRNYFIRRFCNDHNKPEIRWLRSVALDMEDLLEMILNSFGEYLANKPSETEKYYIYEKDFTEGNGPYGSKEH